MDRKQKTEVANDLLSKLTKDVNYYMLEQDMSYSEILGILEILKHNIHESFREDEEDEDDDGEDWKDGMRGLGEGAG